MTNSSSGHGKNNNVEIMLHEMAQAPCIGGFALPPICHVDLGNSFPFGFKFFYV